MTDTLKNQTLAPFGLPHIRIRDALPTNLPAIEANELRLDHLFLLEDGSLAIIDYESTFSKHDIIKYINYIARILKKYVSEHTGNIPRLHLIVIYSADISQTRSAVFDFGCMKLFIEPAFLRNLSTQEIYGRIASKVHKGELLTNSEMLELIILPLTVKGSEPKQEMAKKAIRLAKALTDEKQQISALAGILTFTDKILDNEFSKRIKEEIMALKIIQSIYDDGIKEGMTLGKEEGMKFGRKQGLLQGIAQGTKALIETLQESGYSKEESTLKVMSKFSLSQKEAQKYINRYWDSTPNS
ncbi:MAG: hypothetical protein Q4F41_20935, partial [Eubacteriales bacterium]|nr:hypothetical protein [Eubacteriales bacterium]